MQRCGPARGAWAVACEPGAAAVRRLLGLVTGKGKAKAGQAAFKARKSVTQPHVAISRGDLHKARPRAGPIVTRLPTTADDALAALWPPAPALLGAPPHSALRAPRAPRHPPGDPPAGKRRAPSRMVVRGQHSLLQQCPHLRVLAAFQPSNSVPRIVRTAASRCFITNNDSQLHEALTVAQGIPRDDIPACINPATFPRPRAVLLALPSDRPERHKDGAPPTSRLVLSVAGIRDGPNV